MVQEFEFPAGYRCVRNLAPDLENKSYPDLEFRVISISFTS